MLSHELPALWARHFMPAEEKLLTPPAAEPIDDGESGGDLSPDDDTDCCAAEGVSQPGCGETQAERDTELLDELLAEAAALILRALDARALEVRIAQLERQRGEEANRVNNIFQKYELRIAELEREAKIARGERRGLSAALEGEVRSISEAIETARHVA